MDFAFILVAFALGFSVKLIGLPPLVGFLCAGFMLNYLGYQADSTLDTLANLGITLMLFTIGLKLNIRDLYKKEVWLGSSLHMLIWVAISFATLAFLMAVGLGYFAQLDMQTCALIGFALSFSSTVCVVKLLEENGEIKTRHGKVAVGVLVMQDIFAVAFLVIATGKIPSIWATLLILLYFAKPAWSWIIDKAGHGELLPLTGFLIALGSYELFELVGIKGDLGALVVGMLIASHNKATELSKALLSFKDLFLIGFFLSIGFTALPDLNMIFTALLLCLLLPLKLGLFFSIFTALKLRARTSYLASLVMGNYSEFGLIVAALLVSQGMLDKQWLVVLALSVSFSFLLTSFSYKSSHRQYTRIKNRLKRFESATRLPEDSYQQPVGAQILVVGMGRVGKGAYRSLNQLIGDKVWGLDADPVRIDKLKQQDMQVIVGDGEDIDFWESIDLKPIKLVMLTVPSVDDIRNISQQLRTAGYSGALASIARYEDEMEVLERSGVDKVFNFFTEAGTGFAEESMQMIGQMRQ